VSPRFRDTGKVARARIISPSQQSLFAAATPGEDLLSLLVPGASTDRYGRLWHVGRTDLLDGFLFGRLGFEGSGSADLWNEDARDFEEARTPAGVAAPFAISLSNLDLVFQTRGQDIQVTSFTGAMQKILRDASEEAWSVETAQRQVTFAQWRATVERVTLMRFHIEPPNPNYQGRPDLQRLIEGAHLNAADITLHSEDGINTDAEIATQLLDHVRLDYGRGVAVAERPVNGDVIESVWSSELNGETEVTIVPANPETGEVERDTLLRELTEPPDSEHPRQHG
jgi:hypothetical protein